AKSKYSHELSIFKEFIAESEEEYYIFKARALSGISASESIGVLSEGIEKLHSADLHILRGVYWISYLSDHARAISDFKAACELDPQNHGAHYALAKAQLESGIIKEGLSSITIAVNLDGANPDYHLLKAQAQISMGDFAFALESLDNVLALGKISPDIYMLRILCKRKLGDLRGGIEEAEVARFVYPDNFMITALWQGMNDLKNKPSGQHLDFEAED
ncbi:MAG TPA: tetratricopeptide repeat protein, partial [Candidatus Micrarchaeota archaeon]|nr:tetratricopeptide repeat protein [Candidatus Micrarchaeota archaeon]